VAFASVISLGVLPHQTLHGQDSYTLTGGKWQRQPAGQSTPAQRELMDVRRALAEDRYKDAKKLVDAWIERYPDDPLAPEAYLLRGDAKAAQRDYYDALYDYEYLIRQFPASEHYHTALDREFQVARLFAKGVRRKFLGLPIIPTSGEAEELFIRIQERAPGSDLGEAASLALGDFYFDRRQMEHAAEAYDLFLTNYPRSTHRQHAMLRLIQASLARFRGPHFDSSGLIEAAQRVKEFKRDFPVAAAEAQADAIMTRIDDALATKDYLSARWYQGRGEISSAAYLYRRLIRQYPQTAASQRAIDRLEALGYPVVVHPPAGERNDHDRDATGTAVPEPVHTPAASPELSP
jgi:outer membrane protein assembly factor BamD (BamD/ComL family)